MDQILKNAVEQAPSLGALIILGVSLLIVASLWTFASTRASSEDVDILADKITADVNEIKEQHKEDTEKMVKTLHAIDAKSSAIAVILDRIDKQAGGPRLRLPSSSTGSISRQVDLACRPRR
jgi:hypothetical protein